MQYQTTRGGDGTGPASGLKCIYTKQGSWQEIFIVCADVDAAQSWLERHIVER